MNFLFSSIFWGIIIILIGISIILNSVLHLNIPIIKIFIALFFIYLGITMIPYCSFKQNTDTSTIFTTSQIQKPKGNEYNTIFGSAQLDLTDINTAQTFTQNTIFGSTTIYIDSKDSIKIHATSAFGEINMPNNTNINFGDINYKTESFSEKEYSNINVSAVFGNVEIKKK